MGRCTHLTDCPYCYGRFKAENARLNKKLTDEVVELKGLLVKRHGVDIPPVVDHPQPELDEEMRQYNEVCEEVDAYLQSRRGAAFPPPGHP